MSKNITIIGVGALGSHLVQFLRNIDAKIKLVDYDRVERKNVASQFHSKATVGKSKVQGLQQSMNFLFGQKIEVNSNKLTEDNVEQIISDKTDLVIDCLDNGKSRKIVQTFVRENNIPCLHGALAADGDFGRVIWDKDFTIDDEPSDNAPTCEDGEHLPFIATVAALMARSVQEFVSTGKQKGFQLHAGGAHVI